MNFRALLHLSKKTIASGIVALAFLMTTQTAFAGDFPTGFAPVGRFHIDVAEFQVPPKHLIDTSLPFEDSQIILPPFNQKLEKPESYDADISGLNNLLKSAPEGAKQRNSILVKLAGLYFRKLEAYDQQIFAKQEKCSGNCKPMIAAIQAEQKKLSRRIYELLYPTCDNSCDSFGEQKNEALYYLAVAIQREQGREAAWNFYKQLLIQSPSQKYFAYSVFEVVDFLLANGGDHPSSVSGLYSKVPTDSPLYPYALYGESGILLKLDHKDVALQKLVEALKLALKEKGNPYTARLVKQILASLIRTYADIARPEAAIEFFKKLLPGDEWIARAEQLALAYSDIKKFQSSNQVYKGLINKNSWKTIDYLYEIARNRLAIDPYGLEAVKSFLDLMLVIQKIDAGEAPGKNVPEYQKHRKQIMDFIPRYLLFLYKKTLEPGFRVSPQRLAIFVDNLSGRYFTTFPESSNYLLSVAYADALAEREKWAESAKIYEKILKSNPNGDYTRGVLEGLIFDYYKLYVEQNVSFDDVETEVSKLASTEEPPNPKKIPEHIQRLIDLCKQFEALVDKETVQPGKSKDGSPSQIIPGSKNMVNVKFIVAFEYYMFWHFKEAIPRFKQIAYLYHETPFAVPAARMQLSSLLALHDKAAYKEAVDAYLSPKSPIKDSNFVKQLKRMQSK